ncbi:MAG TPA: RluA family pseudouridine synthase, partial [Rhodospirillales bacterium]|nr:RluA family pseudouridine synthase [Rhodospirillales bacterium]
MAERPEGDTARGAIELRQVGEDEGGVRLDRWFRRHFPAVPHGRVEKLLRGGQIRVDGHRARADHRLEPGQTVRIPPLAEPGGRLVPKEPAAPVASDPAADLATLRSGILYEDEAVIALNKPPGLAVQGGSGTRRHLDGMLGLLARGGERPRLVHRLDKDTSGVLVLARTAAAAAFLTRAFRERSAGKIYWAIVVGVPEAARGRIDLPLAKRPGASGERMEAVDEGERAITDYAVIERISRHAAWLELSPLTGRTHQLRVHCAAIGTPILGDGKYGGRAAFLKDAAAIRVLHLHAQSLTVPHPAAGLLPIEAPLPAHIRQAWRRFGLTEPAAAPPRRHPESAAGSARMTPE